MGTTYNVTGANGPNGENTTYSVTLNTVDQQATLDQYSSLNTASDHMASAQFTIAGVSGQSSDDANSDGVAVGSDGQDYTPSFNTVTDGTNFNSGDFNVSPGGQVTGWVSYELPAGVTIASVQWSPGLGGQTATWDISG